MKLPYISSKIGVKWIEMAPLPGFWPDSPNLACEVERRVVADVARKKASRLTGVLALLVVEWLAAKGLIASTPAAPEVLQVLPDLSWQLEKLDGVRNGTDAPLKWRKSWKSRRFSRLFEAFQGAK